MGSGDGREDHRTLHAYVTVLSPVAGETWMGVVFVDAQGRVLRRIGRALADTQTGDLAAFRAILYALWNSRRLGARWVVVHSDNPGVVAQVNGEQEVDSALVGPYLEVRALLHAYRSARVEAGEIQWSQEARDAAEAARAGRGEDIIEDLPLWAGQAQRERSTA